VGEAIGTLGFDKIHMVILTASVFKAFSFKNAKDLNYDPVELMEAQFRGSSCSLPLLN
jgi:hypothetical protein